MNDIQIFNNPSFGEVRVVEVDGEPYMVGKDVATILGYKEPAKAIREHIDEEDKGVSVLDTPGGKQQLVVINESGLYSLVLSSKLPQAKQFKRWVTSEVLPSIRRTGTYFAVPKTFKEALMLAAQQQEEIEKQQKQIGEQADQIIQLSSAVASMEKKATYMDMVFACKSTVKTKVIAQDYGMSAIAFNKLLHQHGIQYRCGDQWVLYAKYLAEGYVKDVPFHYTHSNGTDGMHSNMQWTQKGRAFLYDFLKEKGILPLIEKDAA